MPRCMAALERGCPAMILLKDVKEKGLGLPLIVAMLTISGAYVFAACSLHLKNVGSWIEVERRHLYCGAGVNCVRPGY